MQHVFDGAVASCAVLERFVCFAHSVQHAACNTVGSPDDIVDDKQVDGQEAQPGALPRVRHAMPRPTCFSTHTYHPLSRCQTNWCGILRHCAQSISALQCTCSSSRSLGT